MVLLVLDKFVAATTGSVQLWCPSDVLCSRKVLSQAREDS